MDLQWGGGAGLLAACDIAIATSESKIGFPEVRRGLIAQRQIAPFLLRKLSGSNVRELLLTGSLVDAEQAYKMGLINHVTEFADLMPLALHLAEGILQGAPNALKATKQLIEDLAFSRLEDELEIAFKYAQASRKGTEAEEGISAFLEKRKAIWTL